MSASHTFLINSRHFSMACGAAAVTFDFETEDLIGVGHDLTLIRMAGTATSAEDAATVAVGSTCSLILAWVMVRWVRAC